MDTLKPRQNGFLVTDGICKGIFVNGDVNFVFKFHRNISRYRINNEPTFSKPFIRQIAWQTNLAGMTKSLAPKTYDNDFKSAVFSFILRIEIVLHYCANYANSIHECAQVWLALSGNYVYA